MPYLFLRRLAPDWFVPIWWNSENRPFKRTVRVERDTTKMPGATNHCALDITINKMRQLGKAKKTGEKREYATHTWVMSGFVGQPNDCPSLDMDHSERKYAF